MIRIRHLDPESRRAGYRAGLVGELAAAPPETEDFLAWYSGHHEGKAAAERIYVKLRAAWDGGEC